MTLTAFAPILGTLAEKKPALTIAAITWLCTVGLLVWAWRADSVKKTGQIQAGHDALESQAFVINTLGEYMGANQ